MSLQPGGDVMNRRPSSCPSQGSGLTKTEKIVLYQNLTLINRPGLPPFGSYFVFSPFEHVVWREGWGGGGGGGGRRGRQIGGCLAHLSCRPPQTGLNAACIVFEAC